MWRSLFALSILVAIFGGGGGEDINHCESNEFCRMQQLTGLKMENQGQTYLFPNTTYMGDGCCSITFRDNSVQKMCLLCRLCREDVLNAFMNTVVAARCLGQPSEKSSNESEPEPQPEPQPRGEESTNNCFSERFCRQRGRVSVSIEYKGTRLLWQGLRTTGCCFMEADNGQNASICLDGCQCDVGFLRSKGLDLINTKWEGEACRAMEHRGTFGIVAFLASTALMMATAFVGI